MTGCTHASAGCAHCYAERFAERWRGIPGHHYEHGFDLMLRPERLELPLHWRTPRRVFVTSMGDCSTRRSPTSTCARSSRSWSRRRRHVFHVLTKRDERLLALSAELPWPANVHLGVTVENMACAGRADALRAVPAAVRHISAEPLLGPLDELDLEGIDWVIAGGESGPARRPPRPSGCAACAITAWPPAWRSPSRGGAAACRALTGGCSTAASGTTGRRTRGARRGRRDRRSVAVAGQGTLWDAT